MITITDDCAQTSALHAPILPFHVTPAAPVLPPARSCHPCPSLPFAVACLFVVTLQNQLQDIAPIQKTMFHLRQTKTKPLSANHTVFSTYVNGAGRRPWPIQALVLFSPESGRIPCRSTSLCVRELSGPEAWHRCASRAWRTGSTRGPKPVWLAQPAWLLRHCCCAALLLPCCYAALLLRCAPRRRLQCPLLSDGDQAEKECRNFNKPANSDQNGKRDVARSSLCHIAIIALLIFLYFFKKIRICKPQWINTEQEKFETVLLQYDHRDVNLAVFCFGQEGASIAPRIPLTECEHLEKTLDGFV